MAACGKGVECASSYVAKGSESSPMGSLLLQRLLCVWTSIECALVNFKLVRTKVSKTEVEVAMRGVWRWSKDVATPKCRHRYMDASTGESRAGVPLNCFTDGHRSGCPEIGTRQTASIDYTTRNSSHTPDENCLLNFVLASELLAASLNGRGHPIIARQYSDHILRSGVNRCRNSYAAVKGFLKRRGDTKRICKRVVKLEERDGGV